MTYVAWRKKILTKTLPGSSEKFMEPSSLRTEEDESLWDGIAASRPMVMRRRRWRDFSLPDSRFTISAFVLLHFSILPFFISILTEGCRLPPVTIHRSIMVSRSASARRRSTVRRFKASGSGWRKRSEEHTSELQSQSNLV